MLALPSSPKSVEDKNEGKEQCSFPSLIVNLLLQRIVGRQAERRHWRHCSRRVEANHARSVGTERTLPGSSYVLRCSSHHVAVGKASHATSRNRCGNYRHRSWYERKVIAALLAGRQHGVQQPCSLTSSARATKSQ